MAMNPLWAAALGIDPNSLPGGYNYSTGGNANFSGINAADLIRQYQADQALPAYNGDGEAGLAAMQARQAMNFGNGQNGQSGWGYGGYDVIPLPNGQFGIAKGTAGAQNGTGYGIYGEQPMDVYNAAGQLQGTGMTPKGLNPNDESMKQFAIGAAFMAPAWLAATGALGAGAGASGAGGAGDAAATFSGHSLGGVGSFEQLASTGAIDPALAAAYGTGIPAGLGAAGGAAGAAGASGGAGGVGGAAASTGGLLSGLGGGSNLLGLGATALGAFTGSKPQTQSQTQTSTIDPRMVPYLYDSLLPAARDLFTQQGPMAAQNASQLQAAGNGLLGMSMTPDFGSNPYMTSVADDLQRRTQEMLGANNLSIQGNSVANGGLGGSRQGVAQGIAAGKAADYLQGNLANLYQSQYNTDANRALQAKTLGAGLLGQSQQMPWQPLLSASNIYSNYTGLGGSKTTSEQTGGGTTGLLGGALSGAAFGHQMGWW